MIEVELLRDHTIQDQRQGRGEQQPETARAGQQAEVEAFQVAGLFQRGVQQAAERNNRDSGSAGKRGKQRAGKNRDNRETAGHPAEPGVGQIDQARRRLALAEQVTGEGEQRDRDQYRHFGEPVYLDTDDRQVDVLAVETEHRAKRDDDEQRCAQDGQQQQDRCREAHTSGSRSSPRCCQNDCAQNSASAR